MPSVRDTARQCELPGQAAVASDEAGAGTRRTSIEAGAGAGITYHLHANYVPLLISTIPLDSSRVRVGTDMHQKDRSVGMDGSGPLRNVTSNKISELYNIYYKSYIVKYKMLYNVI